MNALPHLEVLGMFAPIGGFCNTIDNGPNSLEEQDARKTAIERLRSVSIGVTNFFVTYERSADYILDVRYQWTGTDWKIRERSGKRFPYTLFRAFWLSIPYLP